MENILLVARNAVQIVSAVCTKINLHEYDVVDIAISNNVSFYQDLINSYVFKNLFNNIIILNENDCDRFFIEKVLMVLSNKTRENINGNLKSYYDKVYYYNLTDYLKIILGEIQRKNGGTRFIKYDEGMQSYTLSEYQDRNLKEKFKSFILGDLREEPKRQTLMLYDPDLYVGTDKYKLKKIDLKEETRNSLKSIFGFFDTEFKNIPEKKYLIFEEALDQMEDKDDYISVLSEIVKYLGEENVLVKRHPRNKCDLVHAERWELNIPWEIFCLLYPDTLKDKVLVSSSSTALYTPFIFSDCTCKSVYFYPCLGSPSTVMKNKKFGYFMEGLLKKYNNIMVVSSMTDVMETFKTI